MRLSPQKLGLAMLLLSIAFPLGACSGSADGFSETERHGRSLFILNCSPCHEDTNLQLKVQPPRLTGVFTKKMLPSGEPATDDQVRKTIISGRGTMPAFDQRLNKDDVDAILKYLHAAK